MSEAEKQAEKPVDASSASVEQETAKAESGESQQQPAVDEAEKAQPQEEEAKRGGIQKRISELTHKRRDAETRALRAEQEAADLRKRLEEQAKGETKGAPKLEDFESYDDYLRASVRWETAETVKRERERQAEESRRAGEEARSAALREEWAAKADMARTKYNDFDAVALNQNLPVSQPMLDAILDSDLGAEIAYHLGKNPDVALRLSQMHPVSVAREIGRLEVQLQNQPQPPKATSAPAPINPVGSRAKAEKTPDEMTDEEYYAWRRQQNSQRKRF